MKIEHIAVYVRDLESSAKFFETCFQGKRSKLYKNPHTGFSSYFISFDSPARLKLMHTPAIPEADIAMRLGYAHIAFQVGSKGKVDGLTAQLERDGCTVKSYPRITGDG